VLEKHALSFSAATDNSREFADRNREIDALQHWLPTQRLFDADQLNHVYPVKRKG
jgi:hypothetical protein